MGTNFRFFIRHGTIIYRCFSAPKSWEAMLFPFLFTRFESGNYCIAGLCNDLTQYIKHCLRCVSPSSLTLSQEQRVRDGVAELTLLSGLN